MTDKEAQDQGQPQKHPSGWAFATNGVSNLLPPATHSSINCWAVPTPPTTWSLWQWLLSLVAHLWSTSARRTLWKNWKKAVAKRLKVLKDRICLLYRERLVLVSPPPILDSLEIAPGLDKSLLQFQPLKWLERCKNKFLSVDLLLRGLSDACLCKSSR